MPYFPPSRGHGSPGVGGAGGRRPPLLDHSGQPGWEEQADGAQQAHVDEHPQEDAVDHHGNVLPVFLYLCG